MTPAEWYIQTKLLKIQTLGTNWAQRRKAFHIDMLSIRLLSKLGYRSCSSFSSVLTFGKPSQPSDDKGARSAESDRHPQTSFSKVVSKDDQLNPSHYASRADQWNQGVSDSAESDIEKPLYRSEDFHSIKSFKKNKLSRLGVERNSDSFDDPVDPRRSRKRFGDNEFRDWRGQDIDDKFGKKKWKQHKPGKYGNQHKPEKYGKSRWDDQNPDDWKPRNTSWHRSGNRWDTDDSQWDDTPEPYRRSSEQHHSHGSPQRWRSHQDQPTSPSHSNPSWSRDRPRGKRLRKKEKLGFIESEAAPSVPVAEHLLYGLHPVSLALAAGRRQVRRVYHRADAGGRLAQLLAECAARGVGVVPLPAAQLDRIAAGTGVHQGVCARVTPLLARPVDELLAQIGCLPLTEAAAEHHGAAPGTGVGTESTDAHTPPPEDHSDTPREVAAGGTPAERRVPAGTPAERRVPAGVAMDAETRTESGPPDRTALTGQQKTHRRRVWLLLDRVQDPMNFGSIIRSSYFLGVDAVIIPDTNSCPLSPTVSKASAGTLEVFPIYSVRAASCRQLLQLLSGRRWQLLAAEAAADAAAETSNTICPDTDTLLVVGNEGRGVDPTLASLCRHWTVPPQRHLAEGVESLNVGVATGILLSQLTLGR